MAAQRNKYDRAYKLKAVEMSYKHSNVKELADELGFRPRVARLMQGAGMRAKTKRKFVATTASKHDDPVAGNLLDRGIQYACQEFRQCLSQVKATQSMRRKGNCWDNAVAGSFSKAMKTKWLYVCGFKGQQEAQLAAFEYIETWHNTHYRKSFY